MTYYPRRHYDRGTIRPIAEARPGAAVTILGTVASMRSRRTARRYMHLFELKIEDMSGSIAAVWFNQPFLERTFRVGDEVIVTGPVGVFDRLQIQPVEYEILGGDREPIHAAGLVPSYAVPAGFGPKAFRSLVFSAVREHAAEVPEAIPAELRARRKLVGAAEAIGHIHFPDDLRAYEAARRRLAYEEFLLLQTHLALRRRSVREEPVGVPLRIGRTLDFRIRARFPFALTRAQERVIGEIRRDLAADRPMNRLLQGDVGSGKTIVAAYALLAAIGNRAQAALMAPTEILAEQHARTFGRLLERTRVRTALLTGGRAKREREAAGEADLVIGTHALLEGDVKFRKLAVVVVDEQQKFGVLQRAAMRLKGPRLRDAGAVASAALARPHTLVMTATPIPRTLSMTLYGDLDVSILDELPPGRRPVVTLRKREADTVAFVRQKLREGRQAFFVYPLIDDSDKVAAKSATAMSARLRAELPEFRVELLHGRMKPQEKDAIMEEFRSGAIRALVSTVVVEVGIDVPNASVMVIGNAERYGLAQLHQLRGRIGRGPHESYCVVLSDRAGEEAEARLRAFLSTADGFKIAEADMKIRGPGELFGTRQSGMPEFRAADPVSDLQLLAWAREDAFALVERDPALASAPALAEMVGRKYRARESLVAVG
ncbi:MAG: ATP-dependent DNA helicase RecG [Planctomycetes bacterium]|nr:ATP-dependent DNA helicase RecG [Planctomycetota bacterium]